MNRAGWQTRMVDLHAVGDCGIRHPSVRVFGDLISYQNDRKYSTATPVLREIVREEKMRHCVARCPG
jgi:hypothetical protein